MDIMIAQRSTLFRPVGCRATAVQDYTWTKPVRCLKVANVASCNLPKEYSKHPNGEDAHFILQSKNTIGVADGVGGWIAQGIDGGEYARQLMLNSVRALQNEPKYQVNPKRVLYEAYKNTDVQGSSTACIMTLCGNRIIAANVGDSGFCMIRGGKVIYRSPIQHRGSNDCPYQLGNARDDPSVAEEIELIVQSGDVIVAGTDGLFDNLHYSEIEEALQNCIGDFEGVACYIANLALYNSFDKYTDTPYSIASRKASGRCHQGGKIDDITAIVVLIE